MTPLEHAEATSSKSNKKVYWKYDQDNLSDYGKVTPLEVAHVDIHEDAPKLDAEHIVLLKLKRLSRVRYSRCKAWTNGHGLIWDPLQEAWAYEYSLMLDTEEVAWA